MEIWGLDEIYTRYHCGITLVVFEGRKGLMQCINRSGTSRVDRTARTLEVKNMAYSVGKNRCAHSHD